jgi:hypothetical protein
MYWLKIVAWNPEPENLPGCALFETHGPDGLLCIADKLAYPLSVCQPFTCTRKTTSAYPAMFTIITAHSPRISRDEGQIGAPSVAGL